MTNIKTGLQDISIETYTTSAGLVLNLCQSLEGATGWYINAAKWNNDECTETRQYYLGGCKYTIQIGTGHGFSKNKDGEYVKYQTSEGGLVFNMNDWDGAAYILEHHKCNGKEEFILYMNYKFFESRNKICIPNKPEFEKLANTYIEFAPAPKELKPMPKALRKSFAKKLARREITKEEYDEICSKYLPLKSLNIKNDVSNASKTADEDAFTSNVIKIIEALHLAIETKAANDLEIELKDIDKKLESDILALQEAATRAKEELKIESQKKAMLEKETAENKIIMAANIAIKLM